MKVVKVRALLALMLVSFALAPACSVIDSFGRFRVDASARRDAVPDNPPVVPDSARDVPDSATDVPEVDVGLSDIAGDAEDAADDVPDAGEMVPDSTTDVPDSTTDVPDSTTDVPDSADVVPDTTDIGAPECTGMTTACNGVCVLTASDVRHCGACSAQCVAPNAIPACMNGRCVLASCEAGFADCNADPRRLRGQRRERHRALRALRGPMPRPRRDDRVRRQPLPHHGVPHGARRLQPGHRRRLRDGRHHVARALRVVRRGVRAPVGRAGVLRRALRGAVVPVATRRLRRDVRQRLQDRHHHELGALRRVRPPLSHQRRVHERRVRDHFVPRRDGRLRRDGEQRLRGQRHGQHRALRALQQPLHGRQRHARVPRRRVRRRRVCDRAGRLRPSLRHGLRDGHELQPRALRALRRAVPFERGVLGGALRDHELPVGLRRLRP